MLIVPAVISDQVHTGHFKVLQMLVQLLDCATMFLASNITTQHCSLSLIEFQSIQVCQNSKEKLLKSALLKISRQIKNAFPYTTRQSICFV